MRIRINIDLTKVNRIVKYFILVDLALWAGWGLIQPIFAIFIVDNVAGATLVTVGISAAIYWILKSILQLPIANYLDRTEGEKDDFYTLVAGLLIAAFAAFSLTLVTQIWQLYLVQVIHAIGFALYIPSWSAIFSRHLDKERISYDWSLDSTTIGLAAGFSAFIGGTIANWFGFTILFILAALFSMLSALILILAPELIFPKKTTSEVYFKDHTPSRGVGT